MINFIEEYGKQHSGIAEVKETKSVNGEKSLEGTIYTNEELLEGIGRGWRLNFKGENYYLTYVYPVDEGTRIAVEFDAVHEFFFDMSKSVVYDELNGSNTMEAYLNLIFKDSGYNYRLEVNINAFEKENFGMKNRLTLFKDIVSSTGVEFSVTGKIVRILKEVGTDLSTIVKKGFNLNELKIEKDAGAFITYKKGYGAYFDEDDHSKGRLEVEYLSPLAEIYGKLEGDPIVDERYKVADSLKTRLKSDVENSYGISVSLDMEDLTQAGYEYSKPHEGDYIMAINDDLGFRQKIRILSYTTEYDTEETVINHDVSAGSQSLAQKISSSEKNTISNIQVGLENATNSANNAQISANGKNMVFYGANIPTATNVGDIWYQTIGEETILKIWNGFEWEEVINPKDIKKTAEEAKAAGESAQETADKAQEDATSATEKANNAVQTATQASEKANNSTEAANQAKSDAASAIARAKTVETLVTTQAGQITVLNTKTDGHTTQIGNLQSSYAGLSSTVSTVQSNLDNLKIGSRNLLIGTKDFSSGLTSKSEIVSEKYNDNAVLKNNPITTGPQNVYLISISTSADSTQYTLSFYSKADKEGTVNYCFFYSPNNTTGAVTNQGTTSNRSDGFISFTLTTEWKKYWITWTQTASNSKKNLILGHSMADAASATYYSSPMLVEGNKPIDWSPAPEDLATVTQMSQLNQTVSSIQSTVSTKADKSQITQLSTDINLRVQKNDIVNQINVSTESILIAGNKVQITGQTYIENGIIKEAQIANGAINTAKIADAAITDAKIGSLTANKITAGTLNAANVNIINLNASNITTGTISGPNLNINLMTGQVLFSKGKITNISNKINIDLDKSLIFFKGVNAYANVIGDNGFVVYDGEPVNSNISIGDEKVKVGVGVYNGAAALIANNGLLIAAFKKVGNPSYYGSNGSLSISDGDVALGAGSDKMLTLGFSSSDTRVASYNFQIERDMAVGRHVAVTGDITVRAITTKTDIKVGGKLTVVGSKNAIHVTRDGIRATPAYELAESYLGDIGRSATDETGRVWVAIETLFSDTVNTDIPYEVFLQSYDNDEVWVSDFKSGAFLVCSNKPNIRFAWEIKAKRRGFENERLQLQEYKNEEIEKVWRDQ